ncbi:T-cell activation Rho GTPase-activating protein-like [Grus japonensis]|uniref:T-cell activation Rho GTPase-activating protein-like n=1 Tax=Grus japonensis TaxID=30415 RepID=A0ABC9WPS9_GRUJA
MPAALCSALGREALSEAEAVLSADVRLSRGRRRSERRLLLLQEELVVAKLQRGTSVRPQLRLPLDQLWVLSGRKKVAWEEEGLEEEEGSNEDSTSLVFIWPTGSCVASFGSRALKELWLGTLLSPAVEASLLTFFHSSSLAQWRTFSARSLERLLEGQAEELLAVLQQEGPSTEGIFRRAESGAACRELREALDRGADVDMGSQPALLLAVVLKVRASDLQLEELLAGLECPKAHPQPLALQDFLRSIPSKLLVNNLYEGWMAAMQQSSKEEKISELKAVAEKLPAANLLLLKPLLSLLQHIGRNAGTSRMTSSNLAICVGPSLLSPPNEDLLPLEAMLEVTEKVNGLVQFMMENCRELFGEEARELSSPPAEESPAPTERSREELGETRCWRLKRQREALSEAEAVLSADVRLSRGRRRSERRLLLLQEELVVAKLQRGTSVRPQLRLPLDQLWVLSGRKKVAWEEEGLEEEEGSNEDSTSLVFIWPTGSCVASFGSRALKELWLGTLLSPAAEASLLTFFHSSSLAQWRTFSARSLERLLEGQAEELLAVLQQEGPSTEGIFRRAESGAACRELREALDRGADVDMGSQPALLLAVVLKVRASDLQLEELLAGLECPKAHPQPLALQDFLRSIPSKLLVNNLYEGWMAAMQQSSKEEKISELKAVAEKLPAANLLLLKPLLSLLQHIGRNAGTSRMTSSNLAICVGPSLLSPPNEDLLPLEAMLEVTEKVNGLVQFMMENCRELFGEEARELSSPPAEESPAPTERSREELGETRCWRLKRQREALSEAEAVLSADVRLSRGRRRSERRLLLLQEELVVAKLQRGTSVRPQLRLPLDQLWVLSGRKKVAWEEEGLEEEEGSNEDSTSLVFIWPTGSCVASFGSRALKELWLGTLLSPAAEASLLTFFHSSSLAQWRTFSARSLERLLEGQAEELLAVLQQEGPSTEGIFRRAESGAACRELREALDRGADVDMGSQPALLLAVVLKVRASDLQLEELLAGLECPKAHPQPLALQDFLRSIPSKLLVNNLYEDWMAAMQQSSKEEKISELKAVAEKLPAANLLLLKPLLSLLQHIGRNAGTSRMTSSNLAICVGPSLLSPPNEDLLPLEAMLEVTEKVNGLVQFMMENCRELFGEEARELSSPPAEESPAPTERSREELGETRCWRLKRQREALSEAEAVLSADVRLSRGRRRSERRLLLLQEELVVAKLQRGTSVRPQLRLPLDQLWVLSGRKKVAWEEEGLEEEEGSNEDSTSLVFIWPTGSCVASFGSRALKELWLGTLLSPAAEASLLTFFHSSSLAQWRTFSARSLERLLEGQAEELLAVLQQEGPSTEGIFRRAESGAACRELREALDRGADVDMGSQPALLLAVVLKVRASDLQLEELLAGLECPKAHPQPLALQDFLRSIPSKLLVNNLYEDWMAAMQQSSKEEKISELKAVAEKLPAANLLLLKPLLSLLQHIGRNAGTSRMTSSNLAICVGPSLLSPPNEDLLPLEAMLEVTEKVNGLVQFMMENCRELFGEEARELSSPPAEESPAPTERSRDHNLKA